MLMLKGKMMEEAEVRMIELDGIEEPTNEELNALDDDTIEKMMEEFSIDALLEDLLYE